MHNKKEDQEIHNDPHQIEFVECAEFKHVPTNEGCQKGAFEGKTLPSSRDFRFLSLELVCGAIET